MNEVWIRLKELFAPASIAERLVDQWLPDLVVAAIVLLAFWLLWFVVGRTLGAVFRRTHLDETARSFLLAVLKYAILVVGLVTALSQLGVNTGSILASLGVVGLTIGFAARDTLSNVISGLFIFWDRPFVIGDLIEIDGHYGKVQEITMRSTRVVTVDGRMLAIPNSNVVNTTVASYTNFPHLRIEIDITVNVAEDLDRVRSILLELVADDDRYMTEPAPEMVVTALNDYNTAVQLRAWLDDEREHVAARLALRERAFRALTAAGIDLPFETLRLEPLTVRQPAQVGSA